MIPVSSDPMIPKKKVQKGPCLTSDMTQLRKEIALVRSEYHKHNHVRRMLALSFLQGTASAIGAIAAFVIVIPLVVWALRTVEWPPIISGLVTNVLTQIELSNLQTSRGAADQ